MASLGNTTLTVALPRGEVLAHPAPAQAHGNGLRRDAKAHRLAETTAGDFHARHSACTSPVYTRAHETLLLERQRHSCRRQERHLSEIHRRTQARHPVPAGNQGGERPGGDRPPGLPRVLELGRKEGLFGHGHLLEAGTHQGHQRLSRQLREEVHVCRRAQARLVERRPRHHRRIREVLRRHGVHAERQGRSFARSSCGTNTGIRRFSPTASNSTRKSR